jgi:hypothetical protein
MRTVAIGVATEPETEVTWSHMGTKTARNPPPPQTPFRGTDVPIYLRAPERMRPKGLRC